MTEGKRIKIAVEADPKDLPPKKDNEETTDPTGGGVEAAAKPEPEKQEGGPEDIAQRLEVAQEESRVNYDRFLRVSADFENFKKRSAREMEEFKKFANEQLVKELLPVVDNLERALQSAGEKPSGGSGILEGVDLTLKEILRILDRFGVRPIVSLNEPFDPAFHQAMMQQPSDDVPENTVLIELQKGFTMNDRLLRPAMVVVSAPKSSPDKDANNSQP